MNTLATMGSRLSETFTWGVELTKVGLTKAQVGFLAAGQQIHGVIDSQLIPVVGKVNATTGTAGGIALSLLVVGIGSYVANRLIKADKIFGDNRILNIFARILGLTLALGTGAATVAAVSAYAPVGVAGAYIAGGVVVGTTLLMDYASLIGRTKTNP